MEASTEWDIIKESGDDYLISQHIVSQLKKFPASSLHKIAVLLKIPEVRVAEAQHDLLKKCLKRDSPLWTNKYFGR